MSLAPTNALVAVAWLGQRVTGLSPAMVATQLPRELSTWAADGFVQATIIPRAADVDGLKRLPVVQVDAWAHSPDGVKPPRGKANNLAELVWAATDNRAQLYGRPVTLPAGYDPARVLAVYPLTEPSEVLGDPSGYARFTLDLALDWARP